MEMGLLNTYLHENPNAHVSAEQDGICFPETSIVRQLLTTPTQKPDDPSHNLRLFSRQMWIKALREGTR